jgi:PleD family two-component response regulator
VTKCVNGQGGQVLSQVLQGASLAFDYICVMQSTACILVVDDHREIRELVSRALAKEGFRVSTAADGRVMHKALADGASMTRMSCTC